METGTLTQLAGDGILVPDNEDLKLPNNERRYELWNGELVAAPTPETVHQAVLGNLYGLLRSYVTAERRGAVFFAPVDVVLDPTTVVQPDLLFIAGERAHIITRQNIAGPPDLVIEILSSGAANRDRAEKAQLYARHGVAYLWLVDPEARTLEAYRLEREQYVLEQKAQDDDVFKPALFPGLQIPLSELWA